MTDEQRQDRTQGDAPDGYAPLRKRIVELEAQLDAARQQRDALEQWPTLAGRWRNKCEAAEQREAQLREALTLMVSPIEHRNGCLWKSDKRMPCQCGWNDRINQALAQAKAALATKEQK